MTGRHPIEGDRARTIEPLCNDLVPRTDVRMLWDDVRLMNPFALLLWRICKINGQPSRYRGEPQRAHLPSPATAA